MQTDPGSFLQLATANVKWNEEKSWNTVENDLNNILDLIYSGSYEKQLRDK